MNHGVEQAFRPAVEFPQIPAFSRCGAAELTRSCSAGVQPILQGAQDTSADKDTEGARFCRGDLEMGRELNKFFAAILKPPLELLGFIGGGVYKAVFGKRDLKLSKEQEDMLIQDVRREVTFLFNQGATIYGDETIKHPRPFDYAVVIVSVGDLLFRFIRGRRELRVQFALAPSRDWNELLSLMRGNRGTRMRAPSLSIFIERPGRSLRTKYVQH